MIALYVLGPSSEKKLAQNLRMNHETIRAHLVTLSEYGYFTRTNFFSWMITPSAESLLLPPGYTLSGGIYASSDLRRGISASSDSLRCGNSASYAATAERKMILPSIDVEAVVADNQGADFPRLDYNLFQKNLNCLKAHHIGEPKRSKLAALAWVTPEPVSVTITLPVRRCLTCSISSSRPMNGVSWRGRLCLGSANVPRGGNCYGNPGATTWKRRSRCARPFIRNSPR